jgi:hypothetical protein
MVMDGVDEMNRHMVPVECGAMFFVERHAEDDVVSVLQVRDDEAADELEGMGTGRKEPNG